MAAGLELTLSERSVHPARHAVIVLAAGSSLRLGRDKAALCHPDGRSFMTQVIEAACATDPLALLVVRRPEHQLPISAELRSRILRVDCHEAQEGMAASLRCGLRALPQAAAGVLLLLLDQPALSAAHLQQLLALWQAHPLQAVASVYAGVRGAPAVLPRASFSDLLTLRGDVGARHWLRGQTQVLEVAAAQLALDVDVPQDWS